MTILFMERDPGARAAWAKRLRGRGHRVVEAADPRAVAIAARNADIDAAVIDVRGTAGLKTARVLSRLNPLIRILLVSGRSRPSEKFHFLNKPYDVDDVLLLLSCIDRGDQKP